jgi:predicted DNA-binding protein (MmcQ/YjbR family)
MDLEKIRQFCLRLPHTTEDIQWENDLLFRIGGKMFAVVDLTSVAPHRISFKCTPEEFAELTQTEGIVPAPYLARHHWVSVEKRDVLRNEELKRLIQQSYELVYAKLTKKMRKKLASQKRGPKR